MNKKSSANKEDGFFMTFESFLSHLYDMQIAVIGHSVNGRRKHYQIQVKSKTEAFEEFYSYRRFFEFKSFQEALLVQFKNLQLPPLPQSFSIFGKVEKRKTATHIMLNRILEYAQQNSDIQESLFKFLYNFLTMDFLKTGKKIWELSPESKKKLHQKKQLEAINVEKVNSMTNSQNLETNADGDESSDDDQETYRFSSFIEKNKDSQHMQESIVSEEIKQEMPTEKIQVVENYFTEKTPELLNEAQKEQQQPMENSNEQPSQIVVDKNMSFYSTTSKENLLANSISQSQGLEDFAKQTASISTNELKTSLQKSTTDIDSSIKENFRQDSTGEASQNLNDT